jgi:hypothetical protein
VTEEFCQVPASELEGHCDESWERLTDEPDILGVSASRIIGGEFRYWSVGVAVAEFLRTDPLESELRQQMAAALGSVDGAENVWEDDREVWGVTGNASGEALVRAAAGVVDNLAVRARAHYWEP